MLSFGARAATAQASVPKGVKRIDGTGKWLMPGLTDMHVHTSNDRMGRLYMHDPNFRDGTLRIQDIFTPYIVKRVPSPQRDSAWNSVSVCSPHPIAD